MRVAASVLSSALMLAASPAAFWQQTPPQSSQQPPPPVFRAGVNLVELDVSVFDKDRRPVRGLTAKDFTVLEDSRPKPVDVFSAVDLPDPPPITAEWMKAPPVDVDTNDVTSGRLFVLVMDDQNLGGYRIPAIAVAQRVIEALGPTDLAAVVFTGDNWSGQGFTGDKARLMAAVEALGPKSSASPGRAGGGRMAAPRGGSAASSGHPRLGAPGPQPCAFLDVLREIIDDLKTIPHRRKFVVNISAASSCAPTMLMAGSDGYLITRAQVADINVYSVSPTMLNPIVGPGSFLNYLAESTGGRAIINYNNPEEHVHEIFGEPVLLRPRLRLDKYQGSRVAQAHRGESQSAGRRGADAHVVQRAEGVRGGSRTEAVAERVGDLRARPEVRHRSQGRRGGVCRRVRGERHRADGAERSRAGEKR